MSKVLVSSLFSKSSYSRKLGRAIANSENKTLISGLVGSSFSIVISEVFKEVDHPFLIILNDKRKNIEAKILEKSELVNKKIRDSNLPEDIRIGAIVRKEQVIIPRSNFIFEKDDLVVFLAKREELKAVENIFSLGSI